MTIIDNPKTASTHQTVKVRAHPGRGKRKGRTTPKGRQLDANAVAEISTLLSNKSRQRDLLIEHLHLIQDNFGQITHAHLAALAEEMRIPMADAFEVATFYAHFDVVADTTIAPQVTVRVCDSLSCEMMGAQALIEQLQSQSGSKIKVVRAPCMGRCDKAPVAEVGHNHIDNATLDNVNAAISARHVHTVIPQYINYDEYCAAGGYALLKSCLNETDEGEDVEKVIEQLSDAGLRGLGGAGFPTGRKWRIVRGYEGPRLMAVNGDEGEPGTFKDRHFLETDPHRILEGILIAAWAVEASEVYFYLRDEYPAAREILLKELDRLAQSGLTAHTKIHLRRGAGAYICGEESAMIESIEGKRGLPRHRPPYVAERGLFDRPTLVQNVETMYWIRDILQKGADWFASQGINGSKGLRSYSVSGRVKSPGVKITPAGVTVRELIEDYCEGMAAGHTFKAYLPGGASGGILPADMADIPLDFGQLDKLGCFVGSHAVVILSDKDSMPATALNLMRFFEDESCGQCTPCRVGTQKAVNLMQQKNWDRELLGNLSQVMQDASICGLGQAASNPLRCVMTHFKEEI